MKYTIWHEVKDKKTWNVFDAEKDINEIRQFARLYRFPSVAQAAEKQVIHTIYGKDAELEQLVTNAAKEMFDIMANKQNSTEYHLNHITSGKTVFSLFNNNGEVYVCVGEFIDKNEADAKAAEIEDAYVEATSEKEGTKFYVYALDKNATQMMQNDEYGGEFVADFDTLEDAKEEAESLDKPYIVEMPSEEWWMVIRNTTSRSVYDLMFPTQVRALAFLYKVAKPAAWMALVDYYGSREGGKE